MNDTPIVKMDEGGVNARILAKETKADFRRIEAASVKMRACFTSAEGKRFFVRLFHTLQLNTHFISVIARTRLDHDDVAKVEAAIRAQLDAASDKLNDAIDTAEARFKAHGIVSVATYDTVPLDVEVGVLSSFGRRFLEVLGKLDQLMPLLQTLEIHEILTAQEVDAQRAAFKRQVRAIANGSRNFASGLRRRMNALGGGSTDPVADERMAEQESLDLTAPPSSANTADEASVTVAEADSTEASQLSKDA